MSHNCRVCEVELNNDNWNPSDQEGGHRICKRCQVEKTCLWRKNNPNKAKAQQTRANRKNGQLPMSENKECSAYLGVYTNERLLRHLYDGVEVMPYGHPGYDFICNKGKKVDGKSSCLTKDGRWRFTIRYNTIADYFLLVAYDNRNDLNPMHVWLIPGDKVNHLKMASISPSTLDKWAEYEQPIGDVISCCDTIRKGDIKK